MAKPSAPSRPDEMVEKQNKKDEPPKEEKPPEPDKEEGEDSPDLSAMMKKLKGSKDESSDEDAPEGAKNQRQTSKTGEAGSTGIARQSIGDPALARYVDELRRTFTRNFHPIQSEPLQCMVSVQIDDSGRIEKWKVVQGSGNASFDSAALRAVMQTRKVPAPPDQFLDLARQGLTVQFAN